MSQSFDRSYKKKEEKMEHRPAGAQRLASALAPLSLLAIGCTTMPFMPTSGSGSGLTLATAEHVERRTEALRVDLLDQIDSSIEASVRAAREEDRARLEAIAERVDERAQDISDLVTRVMRGEEALDQIAAMLAERLDGLTQETAALRGAATTLEDDMKQVPFETLDRLRRAIEVSLHEGPENARDPREPGEPSELRSALPTRSEEPPVRLPDDTQVGR